MEKNEVAVAKQNFRNCIHSVPIWKFSNLINKNIAHNWERHTKHISIVIIKLRLTDSIQAEYTYNFF